ncbi:MULTISPECIES: TolC family protein [Methylobacillus]|mgnify:CR=1 FL=1|jgi:cobalt-zinc-cadmium efflux system outer membrane protein|uniref:Outer membrane efflux protein n=1 Tax=Methylobacillus flagellatus (strain ATCC 51484 / DSM 6875 / VKM B-1610 / KT) TaxID=265072 RepID=Q1GY69_METFK|nr:TolC family protein [Methylobacillus flagellatus]ABE50818.1 outer membrane efflux protein [Methylobacillus flagellatus KT]
MRHLFLWISLILIALPAFAADTSYSAPGQNEPAAALRLQDALKLALQANPEIAVAMREREAVEGMRVQAGLRPNPSISTSVETTRNSAQKTAVMLNQPFELGNKRAARLGAAEARYNAASAAIEAKQAEIRANVLNAFYNLLAAQERLKLAQASLGIASQARDAAAKRVQAGKISPVEETRSRVAESAAKIEANQAVSELNAARKRLAALWGNALPRFTEADGDIESISPLVAYEYLSSKLEQAPAIKQAKLEIETRQALATIESTRRTPDITVSVGAQRNEELGANQALLGLTVPIPVFDRNQGNLQEALSRTDKARDELTALQVQLEAQLAESYERLRAAIDAKQTLKSEILPGAQSAFEAASKGFAYGKFSYLEVLDAQRTLFQARNQYLNALVEAHQASAEIERILGDAMPHPDKQP